MTLAEDLLHPSPAKQDQTHKLKRTVQTPDSYYMDVKCSGCQTITTLFSHADTVVNCPKCNMVLSQPTGGLAKLSEGVSFRKKAN
ncbi:40S ribosomal protein S27-like [Podila humilis]|nr:40S ribosomal protein S27-like [Podila humilis]